MNKCGACGKFLSGGAVCTKCKISFHKPCVNLSINQSTKQWLCPGCVVSIPRKDNTNTPLKEPEELLLEDSPQNIDDSGEQQNFVLVLKEMRALRTDMNSFRKEFGYFRDEIREEIKELRVMYQGCIERMDEYSVRLDNQDTRLAALETSCKESQKAFQEMNTEIYLLKQEIQNRDQLALQNDLDICGITETSGENIQHITGILLHKIGLKVDERDIVEIRRVGTVRVGLDGKPRPRPIVMRVARRVVHEQVLRAARTRRGINTGDLQLEGTSRPVYINERLTKENRLLFHKARTLCKQHKWQYVWTKEGKIRIKEADGKTSFRIRNESDLKRFFK